MMFKCEANFTAFLFIAGTMLKCGEDIVVNRGEHKTLKFWSAGDDLQKVQVVPSVGTRLRRPPVDRPASYDRIPGLSEAILAHSQYSDKYEQNFRAKPLTGLHYAGNPDVDVNKVFRYENTTVTVDDNRRVDVATERNKIVIVESLERENNTTSNLLVQQNKTIYRTTSVPVMTLSPSSTTTRTISTSTSIENKTSTTTESIKLVTFFPNLENYEAPTGSMEINTTPDMSSKSSTATIENLVQKVNDNTLSNENNELIENITETPAVTLHDISHEDRLTNTFSSNEIRIGANLLDSINKITTNHEETDEITSNTSSDFLNVGITKSISTSAHSTEATLHVTNEQMVAEKENAHNQQIELATTQPELIEVTMASVTHTAEIAETNTEIVISAVPEKSHISNRENSTKIENFEIDQSNNASKINSNSTNKEKQQLNADVENAIFQTTTHEDLILKSTVNNIVHGLNRISGSVDSRVNEPVVVTTNSIEVIDDLTTESNFLLDTTVVSTTEETHEETISDSVDKMEMIMNTFDDQKVSPTEKGLIENEILVPESKFSPEVYHNIKEASMTGHRKTPVLDEPENGHTALDYEATKASIPFIKIFDGKPVVDSDDNLSQQRIKVPLPDHISSQFGIAADKTKTPLTDNFIKITGENLINETNSNDLHTVNLQIGNVPDPNSKNKIIEDININKEGNVILIKESLSTNPTDEMSITTTESYTTETEEGFKGYDYYEPLYDSLMPQDQKDQSTSLLTDKVEGQLRNDLGTSLEQTTEKTFYEFEILHGTSSADYEETKSSIPKDNIIDSNISNDVDDIKQERMKIIQPQTETENTEYFNKFEIMDKITTPVMFDPEDRTTTDSSYAADVAMKTNEIDMEVDENNYTPTKFEETTHIIQTSPEFDSNDDIVSHVKKDLVTAPGETNLNFTSFDIEMPSTPSDLSSINLLQHSGNSSYQENITPTTVSTLVESPNKNQPIWIRHPNAEADMMNNNILNSIASIIKNTLSSSEMFTKSSDKDQLDYITTSRLDTILTKTTTELPQAVYESTEEYPRDDFIQIPLVVVDGNVKVSQSRETASIAVPISALESEDMLNEYLNSQLIYGSHVLVKHDGNKVSVSSLHELREEIKKDSHEMKHAGLSQANSITKTEDQNHENDVSVEDHIHETTTAEVDALGSVTETAMEPGSVKNVVKSVDDKLLPQIQHNSELSNVTILDKLNLTNSEKQNMNSSKSTSSSNVLDILEEIIRNEDSIQEILPENDETGNGGKQKPIETNVINEKKANFIIPNYQHNNRDVYKQTLERNPARKDDSGHEFGGEPPFFIKLPGSPNAVPLYIQYEPVQVKYVSVENREGSVPLSDVKNTLNHNKFSSRTGIEEEIKAIENNLLLNETISMKPTTVSLPETTTGSSISKEKVDSSSLINKMSAISFKTTDNEIMHNDQAMPQIASPSRGASHAHIPIPMSFLPQHSSHPNDPDPFIVMKSPDLKSQNAQIEEPKFDLYAHSKQPHLDSQKIISSVSVSKESDNIIMGEKYDAGDASEVMSPGEYYSSEHRGTIYGDVDLERLNNPVFKLQTKMRRPTADELMNPAYTPFPITTNPPKAKQSTTPLTSSTEYSSTTSREITTKLPTSGEVSTKSPTSGEVSTKSPLSFSQEELFQNDVFGAGGSDKLKAAEPNSAFYRESGSIEYSPIPASDFRLTYNPSDAPKYLKSNPKAFPSWYPKSESDENSFRAAALTSSDLSQSAHGGVAVDQNTKSEDFNGFQLKEPDVLRSPYVEKASARYTGSSNPKEVKLNNLYILVEIYNYNVVCRNGCRYCYFETKFHVCHKLK